MAPAMGKMNENDAHRLVGGVPGTIRYPLFWTKLRNRQESEQRWAALARQLPKVEDLLQLLKAPI